MKFPENFLKFFLKKIPQWLATHSTEVLGFFRQVYGKVTPAAKLWVCFVQMSGGGDGAGGGESSEGGGFWGERLGSG